METPKKIKKSLIDAMETASRVVDDGDAHDLLDAIDQLHASCADAFDYINHLEEVADMFMKVVPKWINVEDRLPENDGRYIVWANNYIEVADYWGDGEWANHDYRVMVYGVTHWMKLPEMPTEDWM